MTDLQTRLIQWSTRHARLNDRERYIGLSKIGECPLSNYRLYFMPNGVAYREENQLLKFYIGYASEDDIVLRLKGLGDYRPGEQISMFGGRVQGHTDGSFEGRLVEIKSVALESWLPTDRLPHKVWWQVQAYLRYTSFRDAYVIYLARETGRVAVFEVAEDRELGRRIHNRVLALVRAIENRVPPVCECGKCHP